MEKYAQASIGQDGYRYTVRGNCDVPGCVDLSVEVWSPDERRWIEKEADTIECIPVGVLKWLARQAAIVNRIEADDRVS